MMSEANLCGVLLPRLPVYLHGRRVQQSDLDLGGLAHAVGLAQTNLGNELQLALATLLSPASERCGSWSTHRRPPASCQ